LPESLARAHHDSVLSRPARGPRRQEQLSFAQAIVRRLMSRPMRTIAGAALTAVLTGIIVNALLLQKSHRVAAAEPPAQSAPAKAPPPPPSPPAQTASANADPIRDLLRTDVSKDNSDSKRLIVAAQNALIKLGFAVKADGVAGASTQQAVQQFERTHGLIPSGEITPKIVKQLTAAASAAH
jgi:hypothetical protein